MFGQLCATRGVANRIVEDDAFEQFVYASLGRYIVGDWGEMPEEDKAMNDQAVSEGGRIFGAYRDTKHSDWRIWIITEADGSVTTVLFPDEY